MKSGRIILIISVLVVIGFLVRLIFFKTADPVQSIPAVKKDNINLQGIVVQPEQTEQNINASGSLTASEDVILHTETSGKIVLLNIREGTFVTKGALLVKLNDDDLVAGKRKLQTKLNLARQRLERQRQVLAVKGISQEEFDNTAGDVEALEADMEYTDALIRKTEIHAPFSGKIGLKNVSDGSYVTPATEIARMVQIDPLKLDFSVPEKYAGAVRAGDPVSFHIDGSDELFTAKVYAFEPQIDPSTRTVKIRAVAPNKSGKLFPGAFARIELGMGKIKAIFIPTQAVIPVLKGKKVFISKGGKAVSQSIETGIRSATNVEVVEGLMPGDTVITNGIMQLRDGMDVNITIVH
ncbi:MAG TPA: efflux RND transporter periplasmic adaptor subunit [Bacteroidia bacterium]|nr:efflux RND transporter periplasmic adaptor subunit [Bacteroidia bacterium]